MFKAVWPPSGRLLMFTLAISAPSSLARADTQDLGALPEITITADRVLEPVGQTGAAVTIVPGADIAKYGANALNEALRNVAGVDVTQSGGVGSATELRLRGANPGQTLVLMDGVRIGDPTSVDGVLDFGNLSTVDIERVEVLRGPQSALYGSDAMGGVVNIITKTGSATPHRSVTVEAGSYGTLSAQGLMSGAAGAWTYALGVVALHSDGFPRYGYRIDRPLTLGDGVTPLPPLPSGDPTDKSGASGRFTYKLSDDVTIDASLSLFSNALRFDNNFAFDPANVFNANNHSKALIADGFLRATVDSFGGALRNQFTLFGNVTQRDIWEQEGCFDAAFTPFFCRSGYKGDRYGAEYQGDLKLGPFGALTAGLRTETETAATSQTPDPGDGSFTAISARQVTNSVFAEYRFSPIKRLDLTLGGRIDSIESGPSFETWRATAAYHIEETGTKLRASAGTGAKAPTLYQRSSLYGFAGLQAQQSFGYDVGVDQSLYDGRLKVSASYFDTSYSNLIAFANTPNCTPAQVASGGGCYYNVGKAKTSGFELSTDAVLSPDVLHVRAAYTYLDTRDLAANRMLFRVPLNSATISLVYGGIPKLEIEPRLQLVDRRLDYNFPTNVWLAPYAKLDVLAHYKVNDNLTLFGRVENLTDTRYEEVYNFGTAGRSAYAGLTYAW